MKRTLGIVGGTSSTPGGLEAFCDRAFTVLSEHGSHFRCIAVGTQTSYLTAGKLGPFLMQSLRSTWRLRKADVIWLQVCNLTDLLFLLAFKLLGRRVLLTPHFGNASRMQRVRVRRIFTRTMLRLADRIALLFDGQECEIDLPRTVPIQVLGTFLPGRALATHFTSRKGPLRLVHAARFSHEKGSFRAVEVCSHLRAHGIPFEAKLVGQADAGTMTELENAIRSSGMVDQIELVSWVTEAEMIAILADADILLHLSTIDSFPLVVLEALCLGALPVVMPMRGAESMVHAFGGKVAGTAEPAKDAALWIATHPRTSLGEMAQSASMAVQTQYASRQIAKRVEAACLTLLDDDAPLRN